MEKDLVCIVKAWFSCGRKMSDGPKYGECVTFDGIKPKRGGREHIYLKEYNFIHQSVRVAFNASGFVPRSKFNEQLNEELLKEIKEDNVEELIEEE